MKPMQRMMWSGVLTGAAAMGLAGCGAAASAPPASSAAPKATAVSLVTNWFPEPEQAGQYAALVNGDYKKYHLKMTIEPGGPQISAIPLVASGKVDFGISAADGIMLARQQGIPVVAIFATFQSDPQVLIYHKNEGVSSFASMNGHPVYVSAAADYWKYIVGKYHLNAVEQLAYTGSLSGFEQNPKAIIQGYVTEEPYALAQSHVAVGYDMVSASGFNPYQNVLFTTEKEIQQHPAVVRAVVAATAAGWAQYFQNPGPTDALLKQDSPSLTAAGMLYAETHEKALIEPAGVPIGSMTASRWDTLANQMKSLGLLPSGFTVSGSFTNQFLPTAK